MPGLILGQLFDRGHFKIPLAISSLLLVVFTLLIAECKVYWQFLLCQGIAVGVRYSSLPAIISCYLWLCHSLKLTAGAVYAPLVAVVAHWFKRRKGVALGFMALGSSTGGTVLPIAVHNLIRLVG